MQDEDGIATAEGHLEGSLSRDDWPDDPRWFNTCQLHVQSLEFMCEVAVIDTQLMQHGGMQVPDMHDIIYGVITKIISGTIAGSGLDTSTGHPH